MKAKKNFRRKKALIQAHRKHILISLIVLIAGIGFILTANAGWWQGNQPTAYYQFENTLEDNSTNGYDLTAEGDTAYGTGKLGSFARYYDGTDYDYIVNEADFDMGERAFTIAFWFNSSSLGVGNAIFSTNSTASAAYSLTLREASGNLVLRNDGAGPSDVCSFGVSGNWANESWHRIVIARDGTGANEVRCYADGRNIVNGTYNDDLEDTALYIATGTYTNFTGHIDEFLVYKGVAWSVDDVSEDWNSGDGKTADDEGIIITLDNPDDNLTIANSSIVYNAHFSTDDANTNLTNSTLYVWYRNHTIYNLSYEEITGISNYSNSTVSMDLGNYSWNYYVCADTATTKECEFADSNYTINITRFAFNDYFFNDDVLEFSNQDYQINSTIYSGYQISTINLFYNNSNNYGTATQSGSVWTLDESLITPDLITSDNITFLWNVVLDDGSEFNSTSYTQQVQIFGLDNCSIYNYQIFNITLFDEEVVTMIADEEEPRIKVSFEISNLAGSNFANYSAVFRNITPSLICLADDLTGTNYRLDGVIEYSSSGRSTEFYNMQNYSLTNNTANVSIPLYNINSTDGQEFKITYKDSNFVPIENAILDIQRKYIDEGIFRTVERPKTGAEGYTIAHLVTSDIIYNILVMVEGRVVATFENVVADCQNPTLETCEVNLNSYGSSTMPSDFTDDEDFTFTLDYNHTSRLVRSIFSIPSGGVSTVELNVTLYDTLGTTEVCSDSLLASGGTLSCTVPDSFGNSTVIASLYKDGSFKGRGILRLSTKPSDIYGSNIILIAMLVFLVFVGIGASSDNPYFMGIVLIIGSIVLIGLNLIYSPTLIGIGATVLWFIIMIVLLFVKGGER